MFSLWITQRSHLFVIEKMAQLIDFEQISTYFYLDLNALWTEEERRHITSWLTCQSGLPWSSRKQVICVPTQKWDKEWNDIFMNSAWDICFQPLGRKDGPRLHPMALCSSHRRRQLPRCVLRVTSQCRQRETSQIKRSLRYEIVKIGLAILPSLPRTLSASMCNLILEQGSRTNPTLIRTGWWGWILFILAPNSVGLVSNQFDCWSYSEWLLRRPQIR